MTPVESIMLLWIGIATCISLINAVHLGWPQEAILWVMRKTVTYTIAMTVIVGCILWFSAIFVQSISEQRAERAKAAAAQGSVSTNTFPAMP